MSRPRLFLFVRSAVIAAGKEPSGIGRNDGGLEEVGVASKLPPEASLCGVGMKGIRRINALAIGGGSVQCMALLRLPGEAGVAARRAQHLCAGNSGAIRPGAAAAAEQQQGKK